MPSRIDYQLGGAYEPPAGTAVVVRDPSADPVADPDWPGEFLLDTSTAARHAEIADRLAPEIRGCTDAGFGFAVAEDCGAYGECSEHTAVYRTVLDIEYADATAFTGLYRPDDLPEQTVRRDLGRVTPEEADHAFDRC